MGEGERAYTLFDQLSSFSDLQTVAEDIKSTLSAAISELRTNIQVPARLGEVEKVSSLHTEAIKKVQRTFDMHLSHLMEMHGHLED